jgi:lipooligosaccharide transport system ATP-binding protein
MQAAPASTIAPSVRATHLCKRFGGFTAVDGISFEIQPGEVFGFLGPNGAGKTSTMRMIGCVSPISGGELRILGADAGRDGRAIKRRLGVVPQDDNLDHYLSARENLLLYGRYFDLRGAPLARRCDEVLSFVRLSDRAESEVRTLSGGMRRRLLIARALISSPELVILDEPTTGLDPQARHLLWERLRVLKSEQRTLILSTHYMDEAEQLCDRLVFMEAGKIVAQGSPSELIREHVSREVVEVFAPRPVRDAILAAHRGAVRMAEALEDRLLLFVDKADALLPLLAQQAHTHKILSRRTSLEDVFLKLTGRTLVED